MTATELLILDFEKSEKEYYAMERLSPDFYSWRPDKDALTSLKWCVMF